MDNKNAPSSNDRDVRRFDRWAASYDRLIMQRLYFGPVHSRMLDLIGEEGPKGGPGCVIDVGCGTGRLLRAVSSRWPNARLVGWTLRGRWLRKRPVWPQKRFLKWRPRSRSLFPTKARTWF